MDLLMNAAKASRKSKDKLYHLTTRDKLPAILYKGLLPQLGENSSVVNEEVTGVYLCTMEHVKYWKVILNCDTLVEVVGLRKDDCTYRPYGLYSEYIYDGVIPPEMVHEVKMPKESKETMKELCKDYIFQMCRTCTNAANYYNGNYSADDDYLDYLEVQLDCIFAVKDRLNYSILSDREKSDYLENLGEMGEYTFLDAYMDTNRKLYEQLMYYPDDRTMDKRKKLYEFIKETFKNQLHLDTGGWMG